MRCGIWCVFVVALYGAGLVTQATHGMAGGKPWVPTQAPPKFALPLEFRLGSREFISLDSPQATVANHPGGPVRRIRVALRRTFYYGSYLRAQDGRTEKSSNSTVVLCYELIRTDGDGLDPYSWAMWRPYLPWAPRSFRLFTLGEQETYLVFADGPGFPHALSLSVVKVTYPRERTVAFSKDLGGGPTPGPEWLEWKLNEEGMKEGGLLPPSGAPATHQELMRWLQTQQKKLGFGPDVQVPRLEATSMTRDSDGNPVLSFRLTRTAFHGTLAKKNGEWVLVDFTPGGLAPSEGEQAGNSP